MTLPCIAIANIFIGDLDYKEYLPILFILLTSLYVSFLLCFNLIMDFRCRDDIGYAEVICKESIGWCFFSRFILNYQMNVVAHQCQLGESGIVISLINLSVKGVRHNRNQHIQEGDLDQE